MTGVGSRVTAKLAAIGIHGAKSCSCKSVAGEMDRNGPQWVRDNMEYVLDAMRDNAAKMHLPFIRAAARWVVLTCCREEEQVAPVLAATDAPVARQRAPHGTTLGSPDNRRSAAEADVRSRQSRLNAWRNRRAASRTIIKVSDDDTQNSVT